MTPSSGPDTGGREVSFPTPKLDYPTFTSISAGRYHTVAIGNDDNAYAWGLNNYGQLGNNTNSNSNTPVQVRTPQGTTSGFHYTQISAGDEHTVALGNDGHAYAWGLNNYGQLGNSTKTSSSTPIQVKEPLNAPAGFKYTQISAGDEHTVALGNDGHAYAWGWNENEQLGTVDYPGTSNTDNTTPAQAHMPTGAPAGFKYTQISAGFCETVALGNDGNAYAWGNDGGGYILWTPKLLPTLTNAPTGFHYTQISTYSYETLALGNDGHIVRYDGRTLAQVSPPAGAPTNFKYTQISKGSAALGNDGHAYAWNSGQLDNGTLTPIPVTLPAGAPTNFKYTQISASHNNGSALGSDGNPYTWGTDSTTADSITPSTVAWPPVTVTSATFDTTKVTGPVHNDDDTWSFITPKHAAGTVPVTISYTTDGGTDEAQFPQKLYYRYIGPQTVTYNPNGGTLPSGAVPSGPASCTAYGSNQCTTVTYEGTAPQPAVPTRSGYIFTGWYKGDHPYTFNEPVTGSVYLTAHWTNITAAPSSGPASGGAKLTVTPPDGVTFTQVSTGYNHSLAIGSDGNTYEWGSSCGNYSATPVKVHSPVTFTQVSAAGGYSLAIDTNGVIYSWGTKGMYLGRGPLQVNDCTGIGSVGFGQFGVNRHQYDYLRSAPVTKSGDKFVQVSAGADHALALTASGDVYAWGENWDGQLGTGESGRASYDEWHSTHSYPDSDSMDLDPHFSQEGYYDSDVALKITSGGGYTAVAAGDAYSATLTSDGRLDRWGGDDHWPIPSTDQRPANTPNGFKFTSISAGTENLQALGNDGRVYGTGDNFERPANTPVDFRYTSISAGSGYTLAIGSDGNAYAWGSNYYGQLGDGTTTNSTTTPVQVKKPANTPSDFTFTAVSAPYSATTSMAIGSDGKIYQWGGTQKGSVPTPLPGPATNITSVKFGDDAYTVTPHLDSATGNWVATTPKHPAGYVTLTVSYTYGGGEPQTYSGLGYNFIGPSRVEYNPNGGTLPAGAVPSVGPSGGSGSSGGSGGSSGCTSYYNGGQCTYVDYGGTAPRPAKNPTRKGWTFNGWEYSTNRPYDFGKSVTGSIYLTAKWSKFTASPASGLVSGGTHVTVTPPSGVTFTQASARNNHSVALGSDGHAYAWGSNSAGQLGNGTTTNSTVPVQVRTPAGASADFIFTAVSTGDDYSVALGSDGNAYGWGANTYGQLGNGTTTNSTVPVAAHKPSNITFTSIDAGNSHTVALASDNGAYAWGKNGYGKLGNGNSTDQHTPVRVKAPTSAATGTRYVQIEAGRSYTVALRSDGDVYAWGLNDQGQLGNGKTTNSGAPVRVAFSTGAPATFTAISAGDNHSLALGANGKVYAWGSNSDGQLGNGTGGAGQFSATPVQANSYSSFTSISAGGSNSAAVDSSGEMYVWGSNSNGQLGNGSTATTTPGSNTPVWVHSNGGTYLYANRISVGGTHLLAFGRDGTTYAWGGNDQGQLGNGQTVDSNTPVTAQQPSPELQSVKFGNTAGAGLARNGSNWQVTTPKYTLLNTPATLPITVEYTLGGNSYSDKTLQFTYNSQQFTVTYDPGNGVHMPITAVPATPGSGSCTAPTGSLCTVVSMGRSAPMPKTPVNSGYIFNGWYDTATHPYDFSKPVSANLKLTAHWTRFTVSPTRGPSTGGTKLTVTPPEGVKFAQVSAGEKYSLAIGTDGNAYAWGVGQLGNGKNNYQYSPLQVGKPMNLPLANDFKYIAVSAGNSHSLVLGSDGNVYAWGANDHGQLGDGTTTDQYTPVKVHTPAGVTFTAISTGTSHSLALGSDGNVYAWGANSAGELGDGTTTDQHTPVKVHTPAGVSFTDISAGSYYSLALGSDGNTYGWGNNGWKEISDDAATFPSTPVKVHTPAGVSFTDISAGKYYNTIAISANGNTYACGNNGYGQIGNGSPGSFSTFVAVNRPHLTTTSATFGNDNAPGTVRQDSSTGNWTVTTPKHRPGSSVPVTLNYKVDGGDNTTWQTTFDYYAATDSLPFTGNTALPLTLIVLAVLFLILAAWLTHIHHNQQARR